MDAAMGGCALEAAERKGVVRPRTVFCIASAQSRMRTADCGAAEPRPVASLHPRAAAELSTQWASAMCEVLRTTYVAPLCDVQRKATVRHTKRGALHAGRHAARH
jgi:hypothetical protein